MALWLNSTAEVFRVILSTNCSVKAANLQWWRYIKQEDHEVEAFSAPNHSEEKLPPSLSFQRFQCLTFFPWLKWCNLDILHLVSMFNGDKVKKLMTLVPYLQNWYELKRILRSSYKRCFNEAYCTFVLFRVPGKWARTNCDRNPRWFYLFVSCKCN